MSRGGTIATVIAVVGGIAVCYWLQVGVLDKMNGLGDGLMMYQRIQQAQMRGMPGPPPPPPDISSMGNQVIDQVVDMVNKSCPREVDSETRLDSVGRCPGNVFAEYCTLVNTDKASVDAKELRSRLKTKLTSTVRDNAGFKVFRDANVTFQFDFRDKNGDPFVRVSVLPADYD